MIKRAGYTVECLSMEQILAGVLNEFIVEVAGLVSDAYDNKFDWKNFRVQRFFRCGGRVTVCYRDGQPVGLMVARLSESIFDPGVGILIQDLLYAKPGTRAAKMLLDEFIDFGRANANHVISMIGKKTNIKRRSLERLGFSKLEELYRLEV